MFHFIKSFLSVKGKQLGREITEAIVSVDPEGATQAQIEAMEQDLDKAGIILQRIRADYEREVREADDATRRYIQLLAAAEQLQSQLVSETSPVDKVAIETSLSRLVEQIEDFSKEVEQEKKDVLEVKTLLDEAHEAYKAKAENLAQAKKSIDRAKRDMQRAMLQAERSEEKAKHATAVAGLRESSTNKLSIATAAMERRAEEARIKAAALNMKAEILTRSSYSVAGDDPLVLKAIQVVENRSDSNSISLESRLDALREKRNQMK